MQEPDNHELKIKTVKRLLDDKDPSKIFKAYTEFLRAQAHARLTLQRQRVVTDHYDDNKLRFDLQALELRANSKI